MENGNPNIVIARSSIQSKTIITASLSPSYDDPDQQGTMIMDKAADGEVNSGTVSLTNVNQVRIVMEVSDDGGYRTSISGVMPTSRWDWLANYVKKGTEMSPADILEDLMMYLSGCSLSKVVIVAYDPQGEAKRSGLVTVCSISDFVQQELDAYGK